MVDDRYDESKANKLIIVGIASLTTLASSEIHTL